MKVKVTLHVEVPDDWLPLNEDLSTSKKIIAMLELTGIAEEICGPDDFIIDAEII